MEKGFNSDMIVQGCNYHVQTEDWGMENPYFVSRIYFNGAVLKSFKTHYLETSLKDESRLNHEMIRRAMRDQHQKILDLLVSGKLNG